MATGQHQLSNLGPNSKNMPIAFPQLNFSLILRWYEFVRYHGCYSNIQLSVQINCVSFLHPQTLLQGKQKAFLAFSRNCSSMGASVSKCKAIDSERMLTESHVSVVYRRKSCLGGRKKTRSVVYITVNQIYG